MEQFLVDVAINDILDTIITAIAAAVGGYLIGRLKQLGKKEKARLTIEKATARRLIFEAHTDYVKSKKILTVDRMREITETYEAYRELGGNGTAKKYYEEISEITPALIS